MRKFGLNHIPGVFAGGVLRYLGALFFVLLASCGGAANGERQVDDGPEQSTVEVYFTRAEEPAPVTRAVPRRGDPLREALEQLLRGPTPAEREQGFSSFFSEETAGMLRSVTLDEGGHAIVDFDDFSRIIPNASTSTGSTLLLGELDATVFQFPNVRSVTYRFNGNCEAFWEWLQYGGCQKRVRT